MNGHQAPRRNPAWSSMLSPKKYPLHRILAIVCLTAVVLIASMVLLAGCGSSSTDETAATTASTEASSTLAEGTFPATVTDDIGSTVTIDEKPMRIVSTAPASTEILFALGVDDRVVGVTSLDDYPPEVASITKVGDFQANTEAVMGLSPNLVIGYSGNEEALAPVQDAGAAVLILNPATVENVYANIIAVGTATGATGKASELVESLRAQMKEVADAAAATGESPRVFYALDNTLWTAGPGSFVDELLTLVNATNVGSIPGDDNAAAQAYYQFSAEQLLAADPDVILLPNTAYTTADEFTGDPRFAELKAVKEGRVMVINDTIITRPGPRLGDGLKILAEAIHPGAF